MDAPSRKRVKRLGMIAVVAGLMGAAFVAGALANRVPVIDVQSIGGNHVLVPAPGLGILQSIWSIDPQKSLVTDVDLLVFPNAPATAPWQLKLFQIDVQVSCLDETVTPPREFICSNGNTKIVLPTHGFGIRPVRVTIDPPIDPQTTEIHDLSFIVTDTRRNIVSPPTIYCGVTDTVAEDTSGITITTNVPGISVVQGGMAAANVMCVGAGGVRAGTVVQLSASELPPGVSMETGPVQVTLESMPGMKEPEGMAQLQLMAAADAQVGQMTAKLVAVGGSNPIADSFFDVFVELNPQPLPP